MRKEERYCLLSYLRYTSLEKVLIFCVAESGDDDAFTSLIPGNLFLHNEDGRYLLSVIAAVGHPRVPREDAGRAEDASEHEIRSARAGVAAAISCSASPSPSLPCSHSPPPNDGATLAAGWGGRPSYQRRRPRPPNPLFFLSFGYRATEERPLRRKKTTGVERERAASTEYRRRRGSLRRPLQGTSHALAATLAGRC